MSNFYTQVCTILQFLEVPEQCKRWYLTEPIMWYTCSLCFCLFFTQKPCGSRFPEPSLYSGLRPSICLIRQRRWLTMFRHQVYNVVSIIITGKTCSMDFLILTFQIKNLHSWNLDTVPVCFVQVSTLK